MNIAVNSSSKNDATPKPKPVQVSILQRLKAHDEAVKDTPFSTDPNTTLPTDK